MSEDFTIKAGPQWTPGRLTAAVAQWALEQPEIDPSEAAEEEFLFETVGVTGQFLVELDERLVEFGIYSGDPESFERDRQLLLERVEALARALDGELRPNDGLK